MSNHILHVHPTASTSSSIPDLQHQSYLKMKDDEQAREANLPIWLSLKIKFKKHVPLVELCKVDVVRTHDHEDHHDDDAPLRGGAVRKDKILLSMELLQQVNQHEEHQYHLDQMKSYMECQILWESEVEDLTLQIPKKPTPVFQSYVRNLKNPPMSLVNQYLFYLKNGNSEAREYVLSLHKLHTFPFPSNDLEELNTRYVKKSIKRFNLYAIYVVDH
ncbi:hypothetical protein Tco_0817293 [Tanacetum coccineum]